MNTKIARRTGRVAGVALLVAAVTGSIVIDRHAKSADQPLSGAKPPGQSQPTEMDRYVRGLIHWHNHPDWGQSTKAPATPARPAGGQAAPLS